MNVSYHGPLFDYSGYGEANRHAVAALDSAGVNVVAKSVSYTVESSDFGPIGKLMTKLVANKNTYRIKILHTTPDQYQRYMEPGVYHIGHFFWETDKVPADFVKGLNLVDEVWTGSEANRDAIIKGGCGKPVYIFPQASDTGREWPKPYVIPEFDGHLFYSIFEWTDRKNPLGLLDAYWREFQDPEEKVGLLIKTYFRNFTLQSKRMIRDQIERAKKRSGLDYFPPVFLYMDLMDRKHIGRFHKTGDTFISAHRGEGWGIPQVEAMLAGKPIITTGYGGVSEYLTDGQDALVIPFKMIPLSGMVHSSQWYSSDQQWADPDPVILREHMRYSYQVPGEMAQIAQAGNKLVHDKFALSVVGEAMSGRLKEIEASL